MYKFEQEPVVVQVLIFHFSGSQPVVVAVQAQGAGDQEVHRNPDRERVP